MLIVLVFVAFFDAGSEARPLAVALLVGIVTFMLCLADRLSCVCSGSAATLASAMAVGLSLLHALPLRVI